jgi:hypothetical protein
MVAATKTLVVVELPHPRLMLRSLVAYSDSISFTLGPLRFVAVFQLGRLIGQFNVWLGGLVFPIG